MYIFLYVAFFSVGSRGLVAEPTCTHCHPQRGGAGTAELAFFPRHLPLWLGKQQLLLGTKSGLGQVGLLDGHHHHCGLIFLPCPRWGREKEGLGLLVSGLGEGQGPCMAQDPRVGRGKDLPPGAGSRARRGECDSACVRTHMVTREAFLRVRPHQQPDRPLPLSSGHGQS